jgi:choline dehydrogenase
MSSSKFDVAVLGGGAAGCVLAARLSENPDRRVCLVEAGPDYGPYGAGRWPADILDGRRLALESHCWETAVEDRSQLRARIVGGCSAHNACVVLPGADGDYDEWGPGWTADELRPYLERGKRELGTRTATEVSPWGQAWLEASEEAIVNPMNAVGQVRWNAAFAYLDPARGRPNLELRADTLVDRIDPDSGTVRTDRGELRAETIVLTASAYGSPAILLRSGIGPGLEHDLPVGQGLCDHVGTGLGWQATQALQRDVDEFAQGAPVFMGQITVRGRTENCPDGISDLFLFPAIEQGEEGWEISAAAFVMKPYSRGEVRLLADQPTAPLDIRHNWLADERDAVALTEGFELLRELGSSDPVRCYAARELRPGREVGAGTHVRETARGFFHPTGTCAIGRVVDAEARVIGISTVRVADASIMPTIPTANTHLSTVAIAERVAELL